MSIDRLGPGITHPDDPLRWTGFRPGAKWYSDHEIAAVAVLSRVMRLPLLNLESVKTDPPDVKCTLGDRPIAIEVTADVRGELAKMDSILKEIGDRVLRALLKVSGTLFLSSGDPNISLLFSRKMDKAALVIAGLVERVFFPEICIGISKTSFGPELQRAGHHLDRIVFSPQPSGAIGVVWGKTRYQRTSGLDELAAMISRKAKALSRWSVSPAERWLLIMSGTFASYVTAEQLHNTWGALTGTGFSRIYYIVDVTDGPGLEAALRLDQLD